MWCNMHLESDHEATLYAKNVYSREGNSIKIMSCTMNPKLQCMRETIVLEKEIYKTSCAVLWRWSCIVCEKSITRRKFNRHQVLEHAETLEHAECKKRSFSRRKFIKHPVLYHEQDIALYTRNNWSWEGKLHSIMCCIMNTKCMRETFFLGKEIKQTSCGVAWDRMQ